MELSYRNGTLDEQLNRSRVGRGMETKKYSVLMSIYAKENPDYFKSSIESMIDQSLAPDEIVIVKDGPITEALDGVIKFYECKHPGLFQVVALNMNIGLGRALNEGLKVCRNELVARMDTDDISLKNRCESQVAEFMKDAHLDILGSNIDEFDESPDKIISSRIVPSNHEEIIRFSRRRNPFNHPTVMYKKSSVLKNGGYGDFRRNQDFDLFVKMLNNGSKAKNINQSLLLFRANKDNLKRRKSWEKCRSNISMIYDFWRKGYSSIVDFGVVAAGQLIVFIMPSWVFGWISNKFLRKTYKRGLENMGVEQKINGVLNRVPKIKKIIKRAYQVSMYAISPKVTSEGEILRITPQDDCEYFFGYYDKSPWDATDRYVLCLRVKETTKSVAPEEPAEIILIDTKNNNSFEVIGTTRTWNVQQGCMLQWLGPDFSEKVIYNDLRDGKYCSIVLNVKNREEKILGMPVYSIAKDGNVALTLDFSRLHRLRKGYGYSNLAETTANEKCPDQPCVWRINLETNEMEPILKYTDFANFETRPEMDGAEHKVNHIMLNPSGDRFMVLHRWFKGTQKFTRLATANMEGLELFNLSDDNMTSHCTWKSDTEVLAYARKKETGDGYYLLKDRTEEYSRAWPDLTSDGHPSYSPNGDAAVTDTYPNRSRVASVYVIKDNIIATAARVFAPFKYDNDVRCDLHPRWNRAGDKVCFDSVFEGKRGLYVVGIKSK